MNDQEFLQSMTRSKLRALVQGAQDLTEFVEISLNDGTGRFETKRFTLKQLDDEYNSRPVPVIKAKHTRI